VQVVNHFLSLEAYRVRAVVITKDRRFFSADITEPFPANQVPLDPARDSRFTGPTEPSNSHAVWRDCDVAFPALHGDFGEDGTFQGFLETIGLPYVGSGVRASAVGMDKVVSKFLFAGHGLPTPPFSLWTCEQQETDIESLVRKHGLPCFVKCPQSGSSRLMGRADTKTALSELITELSEQADTLLVESTIEGAEFSCPVVEEPDGTVRPLPPVEIRPVESAFFDYHAKYDSGACEEVVPVPRPEELLRCIQQQALVAHRVLGCRGISRTDMILGPDDMLYVLETNTLPGLTPASLVPKSYAAEGGDYAGLLDTLVKTALRTSHGNGQ
jgi:D-alanine-D-alanine ligase